MIVWQHWMRALGLLFFFFERLTKRLRGSNAATVIVTNDPSLLAAATVLMGRV
jgi:hypothetical protein